VGIRTLGLKSSKTLLAGLTTWVIEVMGNLNCQDFANTLWAVCFFSIQSLDVVSRLTHALEPQIDALAVLTLLDLQSQSQLYQRATASQQGAAPYASVGGGGSSIPKVRLIA